MQVRLQITHGSRMARARCRLIASKRRREFSGVPAQMAVFTALKASTVISMGCDDSLGELVEGILSEEEVPLDVGGQLHSVKVTLQGKDDPVQLILADMLVQ